MALRPSLQACAALAVASTVTLLATACSHDFDQFEVSDDAAAPSGGDGGTVRTDAGTDGTVPTPPPPGDASVDSGLPPCTGRTACLTSAKTCGDGCATTHSTCVGNCPNGNPGKSCRNTCDQDLNTCRMQCTSTCDNCLQTAGCPSPNICANALP
jgi:hypothetical protein